jgi:ketosteroid isomerase-like protein
LSKSISFDKNYAGSHIDSTGTAAANRAKRGEDMTQLEENIDVVKGIYAGMAQGDLEMILKPLASDVSWTGAEGFPYNGTFHGTEEIVSGVIAKLATEWDGYSATPKEFIGNDEKVVAIGDYSGTYKATGRSFRAPFVHVWTLKDRKVTHFVQHTDTAVVQRAIAPIV